MTLRVVEISKCSNIARRLRSDIEGIPHIRRRAGSYVARLSIDDEEERGRLHRSAILLVMLAVF